MSLRKKIFLLNKVGINITFSVIDLFCLESIDYSVVVLVVI